MRLIASMLCSCLFATSLWSQSSHSRRVRASASNTPQEIDLLVAGLSSEDRILLTINNNRSGDTPVAITGFALDGTSRHVIDYILTSRNSKLVDFSAVLRSSELEGKHIGYLKLEYSGKLMEVGSQLTLYPQSSPSAFDSPRSLAVDYLTNNRSAAFYVPAGGLALLSFTNVSANKLTGLVECNGVEESLELEPNATSVKKIPNVPTTGDLPISTPVGCDVTSNGDVAALRVFGRVMRDDYVAPIRFYDPATATSTDITAVAANTSRRTITVVHNTTGAPVTFTPMVRAATMMQESGEGLASSVLLPFTSQTVDLSSSFQKFAAEGSDLVTVTLETTAPKGALVGALTQIDNSGVVEDIPMKTSNPARFDRGAYPLRWTEDYANQVTIANTADHDLSYRAVITAGDQVYVLPYKTLKPNSTFVYDVDALRRNQTPDVNGKTLPATAPFGKFIWAEMSNGRDTGLLGRQSLASETNRRRSSFSCGGDCNQTYTTVPVFTLPYSLSYQEAVSIPTYVEYQDTNMPTNYYPIPPNGENCQNIGGFAFSYSFSNYGDSSPFGVAAPDPNNCANFLFTAIGVGSATFSWDVNEDDFVYDPTSPGCDEDDYDYTQQQPVDATPEVNITTDPGSDETIVTGASVNLTASGQPAGGTYSWTSSNSHVTLTASSTSTVTVQGVSGGDSLVTVTYTLNGQSDTDDKTIHVRQPSSLSVVSSIVPMFFCQAGQAGAAKQTQRQLLDQNGAAITVAGIAINESLSWTSNGLSIPLPSGTSASTDSNGQIPDYFSFCSSACAASPPSTATSVLSQAVTSGSYNLGSYTVTFSCTGISGP